MSLTSAIYSRLNNYLRLYDALEEISTQFDTSIQEVALFVLHDELLMGLTSYYKQEYWHIENFNTFGNGDYQLQENEKFKTKEILKRVENEFFFDDYILDSELYGNPSLTDKQKACLSDLKQVNYYYEKRELAEYNFNGKYLKFEGIESNKSLVTPSEPQAGKIKAFNELIELGENQLLMKDYPSFTPHELACFLSDKDPDYINNNNFTDFNLSERLVYKALSNGYLSKNVNEEIKTQEAKEYLYSIGKIYKGFNDNLPPVTADKIGHATITQTMPTDSQLSQKVADQQSTIDQQAKEIADLKAQLDRQANQPSDTPAETERLLNDRTEKSHLITIGILLDLLTTPKNPNQKPTYGNQTAVLNTILEYGIYGQGKSTLETRLGNANNALEQAKKSK